jgi:glycosyltransferase involved in cell wall biosynthesis
VKLLFLYSELGPYNAPVFRELTETFGAEILVVHWDKNGLKPPEQTTVPGVIYVPRSSVSSRDMLGIALQFAPDVTYAAGWMDRGYLSVVKSLRRLGHKVVAGFDDRWRCTARQFVGAAVARLVRSQYFTHAWVSGAEQYHYARMLGFSEKEIIHDLLSCDSRRFDTSQSECDGIRRDVFVYAGNYRRVKGTDILAAGFSLYRTSYGGTWTLTCCGCGELEGALREVANIAVLPYVTQSALATLLAESGAGILPSRRDQWGVALHEYAAAALPLVASDQVGANHSFLIDGFNGVIFQSGSSDGLARALKRIELFSASERRTMGRRSLQLSTRISPLTAAANFVSILR